MAAPLARAGRPTPGQVARPPVVIDPLEELIRLVNEAQERDAEDEHPLYHSMRGDRPSYFKGGGLNDGSEAFQNR